MDSKPAEARKRRLCFVVSAPTTVSSFLKPHIEALAGEFEITVVANFGPGARDIGSRATSVSVRIKRTVSLLTDLRAWLTLRQVFKDGEFDVVHSVTPKAGLLAMSAARSARVPNRFHWYTGQVWATRRGVIRWLYKLADKLTGSLSTACLADSPSQRDFLIGQGVVNPKKVKVLGGGSICGVDLNRFRASIDIRNGVREALRIPDDAIVVLFLGRLTRDKGILDLLAAADFLDTARLVHLVIVGPDEQGLSGVIARSRAALEDRVSVIGQTSTPEEYLAAADILCLPSYREGFGLSVIEAGACMVPSVVSNIYGLRDAVLDEQTGLSFEVGDRDALAARLARMINDPELRAQMGAAARTRVERSFTQERLTSELCAFYAEHVDSLRQPTVVFGTTVPMTARSFLTAQMKHLRDHGWRVHLVTSGGPEMAELTMVPGIAVHETRMERGPSPTVDVVSLKAWVHVLRQVRPDIVMSGTPKAGLLGMVAARMTRVPIRIYLLRGFRYEGLKGPLERFVGLIVERIACFSATNVVVVSESLRLAAIRHRLAPSEKFRIIGNGSSHGVDIKRFSPPTATGRSDARRKFQLDPQSIVVGFAGRLTQNKGLADLVAAMSLLRETIPQLVLMISGECDEADPIPEGVMKDLDAPWIKSLGHVEDMPSFYAALDIFCLPSLREGFPNVNLEASASGLPVITTTATGCMDSIQDGYDGMLTPVGDVPALASCIASLANDSQRRSLFGERGRTKAVDYFSQDRVSENLESELRRLLLQSRCPGGLVEDSPSAG